MRGKTEHRKTSLEAIKQSIKIRAFALIVFVILFLIIRSLYLSLDYVIVAALVVIGLYLVNTASKKAIKKTEEYSNQLNYLLTATRDMRDSVYGDLLLDTILDSSLKITGADAGSILLAEGDRLMFKTVKGIKSRELLGSSVPKSHGIAGWVVENGIAIRVDDVKSDNRFNPEVDNITDSEIKSVLCVPLRGNSGTIGALELLNTKDDGFSYEDEALTSYLADQASVALTRAKLKEDQKNYEIHLTAILLDVMESTTPEKRGHSMRVAQYCLLVADALKMSEEGKRRLYRASLLHDIGLIKINLNDVISKDQFKTHSQLGYEMLSPIHLYADIAPMILHHHERYDGNGYPSGLKGEEIPLESRIIFIAEAFDAMVSEASYKYIGKIVGEDVRPSIQKLQSAIEELKKNAGTQFDPKLVEVFVKNIDKSFLEKIS